MDSNDRTQLEKKREYYRNQFFILGLEIILYFAAPAALGIFLGKTLDKKFGTGHIFLIMSLAVAYVISWAIFYVRYRHIKKNLRDVNEQLSSQEVTKDKLI